jgi:DNA modification methylase
MVDATAPVVVYTPPRIRVEGCPVSTFYHGDCLFVMRHDIPPDSVDLIYLDPPFFTGKVQKGAWQPGAMEISFEDSRQFWADKAEAMREKAPGWLRHIAIQRPDFASYLYYMMERLQACRHVLKLTGNIYLHCDWRASHYLKMVMDEVFGHDQFRNEVIWHRNSGGIGRTAFNKRHDTLFNYSKTGRYFYHGKAIGDLREQNEGTFGGYFGVDDSGRKYREVRKAGTTYKYYMDDPKNPDDVWSVAQIPERNKTERTGYPTQKPEALLERIIKASSKDADLVLDPFCGCGTTVIVASRLGREWIGVDIDSSLRGPGVLPTAFQVISNRSHSLFQQARYITRDVGEVMEMDGHAFEIWVNEFYKAKKPSPDAGVDGITPDGIPLQSKTFRIRYPVLSQFVTDSRHHTLVPKPVKKVVVVSQTGFDDSARRRKFEIETADGRACVNRCVNRFRRRAPVPPSVWPRL